MSASPASERRAGLVLTGVTMELAGTPGPATVVDGVVLSLGADSLVVEPPGGTETSVPWPSVAAVRCGEPGLMADGAPAVAIAAVVAGRLVRWLVPEPQMPSERATAIDLLLATRTGRAEVAGPAPDGDRARGTRRRRERRLARRAPRLPPDVVALLAPPRPPGHRPAPDPVPAAGAARSPDPVLPSSAAAADPPAPPADPPTPPPVPPALRRSSRRLHPVRALWLAVAVLVVAGLVVLAVGLATAAHRSTPAASPLAPDRAMARSDGLRRADLPAGWTVSRTPDGPLSGFLDGDGFTGTRRTVATATRAGIARSYDHCVGVRRSQDFLFGAGGDAPVAHASSPAFAGPSSGLPLQVASLTVVYRTAAPVTAGRRELDRPGFVACFGTAVGKEFRSSAEANAGQSHVTYGTATARRLSLPERATARATARATGVDLSLPLHFGGTATTIQLGFVFLTAGQVEATVVTFATASGFSPTLARSLVGAMERRLSADS